MNQISFRPLLEAAPGLLFLSALLVTGGVDVAEAGKWISGEGGAGPPPAVEGAPAGTKPSRSPAVPVETPAGRASGAAGRASGEVETDSAGPSLAPPPERMVVRRLPPGYITFEVPPARRWWKGARLPRADASRASTPEARREDRSWGLELLNLGTAEQLQELPGIGPVRAKEILAHRETRGAFRRWGDLLEIRGIGEKTLARLRLAAEHR